MGPLGRLILVYFFMGVAVNIFAPALIADTQATLGLNESTSSSAFNASEINPGAISQNMPESPSESAGIIPSFGQAIFSGLGAIVNSVTIGIEVMTWPAVIFSSYGVIGFWIGVGFTLMFFAALFMFWRGVT